MKKIILSLITITLTVIWISCEKNQNDFFRLTDNNNKTIKNDYYYTNPNNPHDTIDNQIIESLRYLNTLLGTKNISYDDYLDSIMGYNFYHNELSSDSLSSNELDLFRDLLLAQDTLNTYYFILELISVENQVLNSNEFSADEKERLLLFLATYRYYSYYLWQYEEWYTYYTPDAPTLNDCLKESLEGTFSNPVSIFFWLVPCPPCSFWKDVAVCAWDVYVAD